MATSLISRFQDETSAASLWAITAAIIISAGIWLRRSLRTSKSPPPPPGPRGLPMVGYLPFLRSDSLHRQFADLAEAHGPIYKLKAANKPMIVVSSPALAKEVIQAHKSTFSTRLAPVVAKIFSYDGNEVAMLPYGPDWAAMRKVLAREVISNQALDACRALREGAVLAGIREIRAGEPTGVFEAAFKMVVDSTLAMLWGGGGSESEGGGAPIFAAEYRQAIGEMTVLLGRPNVSDAFPLLTRFDLQGIQGQATKLAKRFDCIITSVIERRLKDLEGKEGMVFKDLLQILLQVQGRADATGRLLSDSFLHFKGLVLDVASGGSDPATTLIEWAMTELLNDEKVMTKVVQELDQVVGPNNVVEEHHLKELNYLNAVVKETCRLHVGIMARLASQPCTVAGYAVPKGATVFINTWAIHRDPEFWADPLQFKPERFLDGGGDGPRLTFVGSSFQFLPFGSGERMCVGYNLAERLMNHVLASMLHSFEWKLPAGEEKPDFSDKFGPFVKKEKPLVAIPFPRRTCSV
ncbi:unnamed protein product [Linum tenue]|uniref:Cytochrome P450 n=1 Tax=Linum tenue TaxID=586396 RepID=A0AAV0JW30_9ROSI|nr:unnamed protein product [Linum tenue]